MQAQIFGQVQAFYFITISRRVHGNDVSVQMQVFVVVLYFTINTDTLMYELDKGPSTVEYSHYVDVRP